MINAYNDHGQTALHIAQLHGHEEMVGILVDAGAEKLPKLPCLVADCDNKCKVPHNCQKVHG